MWVVSKSIPSCSSFSTKFNVVFCKVFDTGCRLHSHGVTGAVAAPTNDTLEMVFEFDVVGTRRRVVVCVVFCLWVAQD